MGKIKFFVDEKCRIGSAGLTGKVALNTFDDFEFDEKIIYSGELSKSEVKELKKEGILVEKDFELQASKGQENKNLNLESGDPDWNLKMINFEQ